MDSLTEGDLIVGRGGRSAIATLVDRRSRYLRLVHLPGDRTANTVRDALIAAFRGIPDRARWTLTWDQGAEMAHHHHIAKLLQEGLFFAHPGSPWQLPQKHRPRRPHTSRPTRRPRTT